MKRAKGVTWKALPGGEEGLLLKLKTGDYYTLNEVGLRIWEAADGRSEDEIASALVRRFDVTPGAALKDVRQYCKDLKAAGLLTA